MMQMLWRNAEGASRGGRKANFEPRYEEDLEPTRGWKRRRADTGKGTRREASVAASSSGLTDDLHEFNFEELTPPPSPTSGEAPVASSSTTISTSSNKSIQPSDPDHPMDESHPAEGPSSSSATTGSQTVAKGKKPKKT
jgi:hypothetical protein